jgi:Ca2+-binding EF-hand superfamily protein
MPRRARSITVVLCAVAILGPATAQTPPPPAVATEGRVITIVPDGLGPDPAQVLATWMLPDSTRERYLAQVRTIFHQADANGDGVVNAADTALHRAINTARSMSLSAGELMSADLDGDGFVTETELRKKLTSGPHVSGTTPASPAPERLQREIARIMAADTDRDGRISVTEAIALMKRRTEQAPNLAVADIAMNSVLALASPGVDRIVLSEVESLAAAVFRDIDGNHDGVVSAAELNAWHERRAAERLEKQRAR